MPSTQVCKLWLKVGLRLSKTLASTVAGASWGRLAAIGLKRMEVPGFGTRLKQAAWQPKFQSFSQRWLQQILLPCVTEDQPLHPPSCESRAWHPAKARSTSPAQGLLKALRAEIVGMRCVPLCT